MESKSPPSKPVLPGPPGKKGVAGEEQRGPLDGEADGAGRVARRGQRTNAQVTDGELLLIGENEVVARQHPGVRLGHRHRDPGVPHGGHRLDVVPVPVGLHHLVHAQVGADLEQGLVLVGGVDEHGIARPLRADHIDVVVHGADHYLVDFRRRIAPYHLQLSHPSSVSQRRGLLVAAVPILVDSHLTYLT